MKKAVAMLTAALLIITLSCACAADAWECVCGHTNYANYCTNCGKSKEESETEKATASAPVSTGTVVSATAMGFGGDVFVEITVAADNTIAAIKIGDGKFNETKGLGAKALEADFQKQFIGKSLPLAFEDIDAITSATVTSKAVVTAVNDAFAKIAGTVVSATAKGFGGDVFVEITVAADNTIAAIKIGDDKFSETKGLGAKALEADFQKQFIGKSLPLAFEDIDAISGATVTSKAVVTAINDAFAQIPAAEEAPAEEASATEGTVVSATVQGFHGDVFVEITVAADNTIAAIKIGDDKFSETKGLGSQVLEADFQKQFIGKSLPLAFEDIDAISGATITSKAVVTAINDAFAKKK